jgi:ankyrin repeat protein
MFTSHFLSINNVKISPFFLACEEGHKDVVKSLMNKNCNMDIRDKVGHSALHAVCTTDSMDVYKGHRVNIAELW